MSALAVSVTNQWSATAVQPSSTGITPSTLQSVVLPLTLANSVGGGTGIPTAGNWLVCITGWNQNGIGNLTVGVSDDIHSFWRPGNENTSTWAVSLGTGNTMTSVWYTPNLARSPGYVYVAPTGAASGMTVLVVEFAGLGAWDTVSGINTNYANTTSLNLALGAPAALSLIIGAVTGDNTGTGPTFAPASWTTLSTTTAGTSAKTASAWIVTSGSVSVNGTSTSAQDLSGVLLSVQTAAASPVPAANNPSWPYLKFEAAFGAGFQTPPDQLTWTDLTSRLWSWDETSGVQFQLGQLQASNVQVELDNNDDFLSTDNVASPYYSNALNSNMSFQGPVSGTGNISPWTAAHNATLASSTAHVFASAVAGISQFSLQVTPDGVTAVPGAASEQVAATVGAAYSASAWFYSVAGYATGAQVAISWYNSSHTLLSTVTSGAVNIPAATWTQVKFTSQVAPASTAFAAVTVQFAGTPAATAFWVAEAALVAGASAVSTGLVTTGTPCRIRAAAGTIGGVTVNRWYVIQKNIQGLPQKIDENYRRYIAGTLTDIWSAIGSAYCLTPYRGEVSYDNPYAHWACDDQPLAAGVLPTTLLNSAPGNSNVLNIKVSPNGALLQDFYSTSGTDLNAYFTGGTSALAMPNVVSCPVYQVGVNQGWMYGDPQSNPLSVVTENPVTALPGSASAAFAQQAGNNGQDGWWMYVNDTAFPVLANGVTIEGWFNCAFSGSSAGIYDTTVGTGQYNIAQQPVTSLTLWEIATNGNPVAVLQLDTSGHLNFITYNGATGTTHGIYSSSDLRAQSWFHVAVTMTTSNWTVYVNGGITATVSGSGAGMTSAWTWYIVNGDLGSNGGSTAGTGLQHSGNIAFSHLAVYPAQLPSWRIMAHYWAALCAFGLIPAPQAVQISPVPAASLPGANTFVTTSFTPDGTAGGMTATGLPFGTYGETTNNTANVVYSFAAVISAVAGSFNSGPSAWAVIVGNGQSTGGIIAGNAVYVSWAGIAPKFNVYTATAINTEKQAAVVLANSDSFTAGYGSTATDKGPGHVAAGNNSSPPTSATATGDTAGQRIERILSYGDFDYPGRSIDPAILAISAGTDIGGQQAGFSIQNIAGSDGGMLYVDNNNYLVYWSKAHLASQYSLPAWLLSPAGISGTGSVTSPGTFQIFLTIPVSPGTYTISWTVTLSGTLAAADANNFGITLGSGPTIAAPSVNAGAAGTYPQKPVTFSVAAPDTLTLKSWSSTPTTGAVYGGTITTGAPYGRDVTWTGDPMRIWNAITVQPFSPDGAALPLYTPTNTSANAQGVLSSQTQFGVQPKQITSYLQSTAEMQSQANWLYSNFGQLQNRVDGLKVDAASYLAGWSFVLGASIGDVVTVQNWQAGGGEVTGTFRITEIRRRFSYDTHGGLTEASLTITADWEPTSYWT